MQKIVTSYIGILIILLVLTCILSYISYNAFLVTSGALLIYFTYFVISTCIIKPIKEYKKIKQDIINFKNKHTRII